MTERAILIFIGYLYFTKGIRAVSVDKMLAALRMLHMTLGHQAPMLRPNSVKLVLKGLKNKDEEESRDKPGRQPVTEDFGIVVRLASFGWNKVGEG
jgi:hypothetical protein